MIADLQPPYNGIGLTQVSGFRENVRKCHEGDIWRISFQERFLRTVTPSSWDDPSLGKLLATFQGHTGRVTSAVFRPDGRRVLTASGDKTARLWSVNCFKCMFLSDEKTLQILSGQDSGPNVRSAGSFSS